MKTHRKGSDLSDKRAAFRDIEEQTISLGKKTRNEVSQHSNKLVYETCSCVARTHKNWFMKPVPALQELIRTGL